MKCDLCESLTTTEQDFSTCGECGLIQKLQTQAYNGSDSNWGQNYLSKYEEGMPWRNQIATSRSSLIESVVKTEITHLDLGGANGGISKIMADRGHKSTNFEPDPTFAQASRDNGVETFTDLDETVNGHYNVVTSYDSLGCSINIKNDLELISKKLAKDSMFWGTFGYAEYGLKNCPDLSLNYYLRQKTVARLASFLGGGRFMLWVEDRSFNLEEAKRSDKYWLSKLKLTDEPKITNLIVLKGKWADLIPEKATNFWNFSE